jgi:hypothetical protein
LLAFETDAALLVLEAALAADDVAAAAVVWAAPVALRTRRPR